jgi:glyoxylate/succinic semialdehyde reductase
MATDNSKAVGFIGLGIMGLPMCLNLVKAGRNVIVWNRTIETSQQLAAAHPSAVTVAASADDVVARCDLIYSMLSTLEASEAVFPSVMRALAPGKMIVDCATLTVARMQQIAFAVRSTGAKFLEAPVSGSKGPAEAGQLIFLTSGDEEVSVAAAADLASMGKKTFYFGATVGKGTEMKLVVNMVMAVQLNAVAEGVTLAEACDLDVNALGEILNMGAMASPMMKLKFPMMAAGDLPPQFPLKHAQKDLRFAVDMADQHDAAVPLSAASNEQYKLVRAEHGDSDFGAIVHATRRPKRKSD